MERKAIARPKVRGNPNDGREVLGTEQGTARNLLALLLDRERLRCSACFLLCEHLN